MPRTALKLHSGIPDSSHLEKYIYYFCQYPCKYLLVLQQSRLTLNSSADRFSVHGETRLELWV